MNDNDGDDDEIFAYRIFGPTDAGDEGENITVRGGLTRLRLGRLLAVHQDALRIDLQVPEGSEVADEDLGSLAEANEITIRVYVQGTLRSEYTGEAKGSS
ncbi:hypothetical protein ACXJJ3_38195 [Kribbella sp. WER1]